MRSEYVLAAKARELRLPTLPSTRYQSDAKVAKSDLSEALMSPRATELTANPFDSAMGTHTSGTSTNGVKQAQDVARDSIHGQRRETPSASLSPEDPRSPPQRGLSPIVRSIFDAFS